MILCRITRYALTYKVVHRPMMHTVLNFKKNEIYSMSRPVEWHASMHDEQNRKFLNLWLRGRPISLIGRCIMLQIKTIMKNTQFS